MKFALLQEAIMICRKANVSLMIWGHRGLGKSSAVAEVCYNNKMGHINMRLSQMEASDIRGLPDRQEGRTIYLPPADMPIASMTWAEVQKRVEDETDPAKQYTLAETMQSHISEGILFLDEINRAQDDVLQAAFELVLDRKVGQYVLPPKWSIVCAGNFNEGAYMTNGFTDEAFLDRFCHVILSDGETTLEEWVTFMASKHGDAAANVIEFATQNTKNLDGQVEGELGFSIQPSRRSWEAVVRVMKICQEESFSGEAMTEVLAGLVGRELALSFTRYECPVKPKEIIERGVKPMEGKLKKLTRNQLVGLMWGLVSYVKPNTEKEKYTNPALDFAEWMLNNSKEKDLVVAFAKALVTEGHVSDDIRAAAISNPKVAALLKKAGKRMKGNKTFLDRICDRPKLQALLSKTAWGTND